MKKINLREITLIIIALIPAFYLAYIWKTLPEKVPLHWTINGEVDRYGSKQQLIWISLFLPLFIYILLSFIPKIDPKNQLNKMGEKYQNLKFLLVVFMSLLAGIIIYAAKTGNLFSPKYILLATSGLFIILGNYMKTIKPNYFVGIRTPWTLENKEVWKKTHSIASYLWFWGGVISIILILLLPEKIAFIAFLSITLTISFIPVFYSYWIFKKYH